MSTPSINQMIPLLKVHRPIGIERAIASVWDSGYIGEGVLVEEFETSFGDYVGNARTSMVNSCTSAITLATRLCDIQPGDEVITTPMTCAATNVPFAIAGANLVWADIDPRTGNISAKSVAERVSRKTKAIVGVHWGGQPFDIAAIHDIAAPFGISVVEDAAHALGAMYQDTRIGSHSDFVCFSFQAVKHLTTADGGALCVKSDEDDRRAKLLRWYGVDRKFSGPKWKRDIPELGYKFHMNDVTAAIGLLQLGHLPAIIDAHQRNARFFDDHISNPRVGKLVRDVYSKSAAWVYTILVEDQRRFCHHMRSKGIECDVLHYRNDRYTMFRKFGESAKILAGVDEFCSQQVNVPVGWWLSDPDIYHIVDMINEYR